MKTLRDYLALVEGRTAYLYHGTNAFAAGSIIIQNRVKANTEHDISGRAVAGVSLSRDPSVSARFGTVVFVLDQTLLRQRSRLIPKDYWHRTAAISPDHKRESGAFTEAEEFLVGDLDNLSRVLVEVRIASKDFRNLEAKSEDGVLSTGEAAIFRHPKLAVRWTATNSVTYPNRPADQAA